MAANPNVIPTCSVPVGFAVAAGVAGVAVAVGVGQAADWITCLCRATAKDDVFGWLRAIAAIDLAVVSIVCAAQPTMMHTHAVLGGGS